MGIAHGQHVNPPDPERVEFLYCSTLSGSVYSSVRIRWRCHRLLNWFATLREPRASYCAKPSPRSCRDIRDSEGFYRMGASWLLLLRNRMV